MDLFSYFFTRTTSGGGGDVSTKMNLAPLNPTAQEIEDMPDGQLYSDTANHKGVIKGGQEFYDTDYIDSHIPTDVSQLNNDINYVTFDEMLGEGFIYQSDLDNAIAPIEKKLPYLIQMLPSGNNLISGVSVKSVIDKCFDLVSQTMTTPIYIYIKNGSLANLTWLYLDTIQVSNNRAIFKAHYLNSNNGKISIFSKEIDIETGFFELDYIESGTIYSYTKTEINNMIGDIGSRLDQVRGVSNE